MSVRLVPRALSLATASVALVASFGAVVPAGAADDFGSHVATCAQEMGFSGQHNPGMHHGRAGWDPTHTC